MTKATKTVRLCAYCFLLVVFAHSTVNRLMLIYYAKGIGVFHVLAAAFYLMLAVGIATLCFRGVKWLAGIMGGLATLMLIGGGGGWLIAQMNGLEFPWSGLSVLVASLESLAWISLGVIALRERPRSEATDND